MPQLSNTNRVQHNLEQHLSKLNSDRKAHNWGCLYSLPTQNVKAFAGNSSRYSLTSFYNDRHLPEQLSARPRVLLQTTSTFHISRCS